LIVTPRRLSHAGTSFPFGTAVEDDIEKRYLYAVNNKHRTTLQAVFERPTRADIRWSDIESLIRLAAAKYMSAKEAVWLSS